jgi:hypothetical protein
VLSAQKLQESGIIASPRSAFSLNLARVDFFRFGALEDQLGGHNFESAEELVEEICKMVSAIPRAKPDKAFLEREESLQECIGISDAYVD